MQVSPQIKINLLIAEAKRWIGVHERGGNNSGEIIRLFQNWDLNDLKVPWCLAFIQYCVKMVDLQFDEIRQMSGAHTNLWRTEHCMTLWRLTPQEHRISDPEPGCIVVWNFAGTDQGHVGIVIGVTKNEITTIEGNTSAASAGIEREGEGVYLKFRPRGGLGRMQVVGFLKPWPLQH